MTQGQPIGLDDCVVLVDKPAGKTSFDVVREFRRLARVRKVGHCGSLDPQATGLLLLCSGLATRLADVFMDQPKEYAARIRFGRATHSYDADGTTTAEAPVPALSRADVQAALAGFQGEIEQVPPMVSALKHQGKRLYALARAGEHVDRAPRRVHVHAIELLDLGAAHADVRVVCGRGCYVRSIAHDLGQRLGVPAHLEALRRNAIGAFRAEDATDLDTLRASVADAGGRPVRGVRTLPEALAFLPALAVRAGFERAVAHGAQPELGYFEAPPESSGPHRLVSADQARLLAVAVCDGRRHFARVRLIRVFPDPLPAHRSESAAT
jgi:tRNA pseudouridine55 synthase